MKAVIAALAVNLGIAITKFAAFLVTGSASMLAESVHSVADTGNELLLLIGSGRSRRWWASSPWPCRRRTCERSSTAT